MMAKNDKPDWRISLDEVAKNLAEMSAREKKTAKEIAEVWKITRENGKLIGSYTSDESEMLEQQVAAAIIKKMALGDVRFDEVITNAQVYGKYGDGEFDWVGINGKITIVGETRRALSRGDARLFFKDRVELFKRAFPHYAKGKQVQGALVYQTAKAGAVKEALDLGMIVFRAEGKKTLRPITTPADILPKRTKTQTHKHN